MIQTVNLLPDGTVGNVTGPTLLGITPGGYFQSSITGTGVISATVTIYGSLDGTNWISLGAHSLSGTTTDTKGFAYNTAVWVFYRAIVTSATGTISKIISVTANNYS